jgi:hypothetical protein
MESASKETVHLFSLFEMKTDFILKMVNDYVFSEKCCFM